MKMFQPCKTSKCFILVNQAANLINRNDEISVRWWKTPAPTPGVIQTLFHHVYWEVAVCVLSSCWRTASVSGVKPAACFCGWCWRWCCTVTKEHLTASITGLLRYLMPRANGDSEDSFFISLLSISHNLSLPVAGNRQAEDKVQIYPAKLEMIHLTLKTWDNWVRMPL